MQLILFKVIQKGGLLAIFSWFIDFRPVTLIQSAFTFLKSTMVTPSNLATNDTRVTSLTSFGCIYFQLQTNFKRCLGDSVVDFEQVNTGCD